MNYKKGDIVQSTRYRTLDEIGVVVRSYNDSGNVDVYVVEGFSHGEQVYDGRLYSDYCLKPVKNIDDYNKEELEKVNGDSH